MNSITIRKKFISKEELRRRKAQNFLYLLIAKGLFEDFLGPNSPFTVSYIDKDNVVLLLMGNKMDPFISEGLVVSKELFGKTAISLCIEQNRTVEVKGSAHTDKIFKDWSCTASPVRNEKGELVGIMSLSSLSKYYPRYAKGIISALAHAVENEANLKNALNRVELSKKYIEVIGEGNKDGILLLDKDAHVIYINSSGADILHINKKNAIGKDVSEIVDFTPVILSVFKTHKGYVDKEFIIDSPSRGILHFIKTATVVRDKDGNFAGVVDTFREISRVRKFVTSYIGAEARFTFQDIIGKSKKLKEAIRIAKIAAKSNSSVLISGETGTGKEMFAQAIHFESNRSKGPFVALNCGAVPRDLAESELFGYEPGSFTDADKRGRPGKFELADHGTIFLDEIGELPLAIQTKLLRVLEDRVITRIGGTRSLKVDVRVIAATNKELNKFMERGEFRKDLYYRLNVIQINIPPLRERREDIPLLVDHFVKKFNTILHKDVKRVDESFIAPLMDYDFPGNVRELENIVERAMNIAEGDVLKKEYLPETIVASKAEDISPMDTMKKRLIEKILLETNHNISLAANKLNISRPTLYKLLKKYNIS